MDILGVFYSFILTSLLYFKGAWSITIQQSVSPGTPVLGNSQFTLNCQITVTPSEQLLGVELKRKRKADSDFTNIVIFPGPSLHSNYTINDTSLASRTIIIQPDATTTTTASVTFTDTLCSDVAQYKWAVRFYDGGYPDPIEETSDVKVQVQGSFTGSDFGLTSSTGYDVEEGTNVTFTCKARIGAEPTGQLLWYKIIGNPGILQDISIEAIKGAPETEQTLTCSYTQVSTLQLTMTQALNGVVVRCTLQQNGVSIDDDRRQTNAFNVTYSTRQTSISVVPSHNEYSEGESQVALTCTAVANPAPTYSWLLPNGSTVDGPTYTLRDLKINDTGNYTCIAKNGIPNENYTDSATHLLTVVEKTTTTTTTTVTTPTTPAGSQKPTTQPSTGGDDDDKTTIIIIVVCVVGGVIIIVVIVIICCVKRKKKQEIEEPPEKPRNNQDLNFSQYRPGLTTSNESLKNSGNNLNTSFNSFDSSESKHRNEDGLMYVDLKFDDQPRSRRPIQVYDNGSSTQYADIAMPRV